MSEDPGCGGMKPGVTISRRRRCFCLSRNVSIQTLAMAGWVDDELVALVGGVLAYRRNTGALLVGSGWQQRSLHVGLWIYLIHQINHFKFQSDYISIKKAPQTGVPILSLIGTHM